MAKILIVDDNTLYRELAGTLLTEAGQDILEAESGEEALRIAQAEHPDLILMDLSMPEMDGVTALRRLRQISAIREVPIVAVTGYPEKWARELVTNEGFQGYIEKPFRPETFVDEALAYLASAKDA
ncbi:MAG TPA: response regulator [Mariprofundaceae bacterium]|nr:response regulator [Mariprofundaceae bacterium]